MYNTLKSFAQKIVPKEILVKNEDLFRKLLMRFYSGDQHECNICGSKLKKFASLENGQLLCPICGSLPRTRRLFMLLEKEYLQQNAVVLDFSPSRAMYRKLKQRKDLNYYPSDFENEFLADYHFDITKIAAESDQFDLITCYHILEHIVEDEVAMKELFRVLKPSGTLLIQTPFKGGDIYEDFTKTTVEQKLKYFGQDDHVRIYSAEGLEKRLQGAGFKTEIRKFEKDDYFGLTENEQVIICRK